MVEQKQQFYIIAHNPNTVADALEYMKAGANALEPDVCFSARHPDRYYVSHDHVSSNPDSHDFDFEHSLKNYMSQLRSVLVERKFNLALITFDYKDAPHGDINEMLKIVQDNFSSHEPICQGVALCVTVAHLGDAGFLNKYSQNIPNAGVIIDQDDD